MKKSVFWSLLLGSLVVLTWCNTTSNLDLLQTHSGSTSEQLELANPASEYCIANGGSLEKQSFEYGEVQNCVLPNGVVQEEWSLYRSAPYIWLTVSGALAKAEKNNTLFRIVEEDGEPLPMTMDLMPGRINATVQSGVVISAFSE